MSDRLATFTRRIVNEILDHLETQVEFDRSTIEVDDSKLQSIVAEVLDSATDDKMRTIVERSEQILADSIKGYETLGTDYWFGRLTACKELHRELITPQQSIKTP